MDRLRVFTAFSGYDSQCMALDRLGIDYELVGWSEIDKYAIQAHNAVYPQWKDRNLGDICNIVWSEVPDFDLFTYSFPCTDISSAGQQKGMEEGSGTRSSLLWECKKAIEEKHPKYLLMENVKALTSTKFLPYLQKWIAFLDGLGYSSHVKVLNAKDYGVPQNRERVFVVSILGDNKYQFPEPFELKARLKDVLEPEVEEKYYLADKMREKLTLDHKEPRIGIIYEGDTNKGGQKGAIISDRGICSALTATDYKQPKQIIQPKYGNSRVQRMVDNGKIKGDRVEFIDAYNQTTKEKVSGTITSRVGASNMMFISEPKTPESSNIEFYEEKDIIGVSVNPNSRKLEFKGPKSIKNTCPSLRATDYKCPHTVWESGASQDYRIRKLTPRECFRLMGVSEENIDKIQDSGISKTQQYKMAGNSIVVDVLCNIFRKLFIDKDIEDLQLELFNK